MEKFTLPVRRIVVTGALALTVAAAPAALLFAPSASADDSTGCPNGESADLYTNICVPELVPNVPAGSNVATPEVPNDYFRTNSDPQGQLPLGTDASPVQ